MNRRHEIRRSCEVHAPADTVWAILSDSAALPEWARAVEAVTSHTPGPEHVGSTRECRVDFAGRRGTIVERCVELCPGTRIAYVVDDDSLGFKRMFADYGFAITVETGAAPGSAIVQMDTHYTPRTSLAAALNTLFMRRRFARTVEELLLGLGRLAEQRAPALTR